MSPETAPGWTALWEEYRRGLTELGIDVTIPTKLRGMLQEIPCLKDNIVAQEALVPIGESYTPIRQLILSYRWRTPANTFPLNLFSFQLPRVLAKRFVPASYLRGFPATETQS